MNAIIMTAVTLLGGFAGVTAFKMLLGNGDQVWAVVGLLGALGAITLLWEAWRDAE